MLARVPISLKLSALVVLMVVATALMVNQLYLRGSSQILTEQAIGELQNQTRSYGYPLKADIDQLQNDTRLLASLESSKASAWSFAIVSMVAKTVRRCARIAASAPFASCLMTQAAMTLCSFRITSDQDGVSSERQRTRSIWAFTP